MEQSRKDHKALKEELESREKELTLVSFTLRPSALVWRGTQRRFSHLESGQPETDPHGFRVQHCAGSFIMNAFRPSRSLSLVLPPHGGLQRDSVCVALMGGGCVSE